jgi:hypothetical protein
VSFLATVSLGFDWSEEWLRPFYPSRGAQIRLQQNFETKRSFVAHCMLEDVTASLWNAGERTCVDGGFTSVNSFVLNPSLWEFWGRGEEAVSS